MRLAEHRMKDKEESIGLKRSTRNLWAEKYEDLVRNIAPFPISYDVDCTQGLDWSEFTYTEYVGGMLIKSQNIETNTRLFLAASEVEAKKDNLEEMRKLCVDKYDLKNFEKAPIIKDIGFMVGHNMFDLVSSEIVSRIAFENDDFKLKLHPLTNKEYAGKIAHFIGWDKIIMANYSGVELLRNCETAYVHSATEMCSMAVALGKKIVNIGNFFNEAGGVYYGINKLLFKSEDPQKTLNNIIDCEFSGIIMPFMQEDEIKYRMEKYFEKALEIRKMFKPIASKNNLKKIPTN